MNALEALPPLGEIVEEFGLNARKDLGQNFLFDLNLTRRIARTSGPLEDVTVIEIGPGPGGLTRALLLEGAKKVIAIERDERVLPILAQISDAAPGRLDVILADALEVDYANLAEGPTRIVANLPYNIATPLLTGWLSGEAFFQSLTLMFQKEVGARICAEPGSKTYGRLSILSGWRAKAYVAFDINKEAFTPPPKVTSSLVHLVPTKNARDVGIAALEEVTRAAFGQRRKMVRQSLKGLGLPVDDLLNAVGLKGTERAEVLPVDVFLDMAEYLIKARKNNLKH